MECSVLALHFFTTKNLSKEVLGLFLESNEDTRISDEPSNELDEDA